MEVAPLGEMASNYDSERYWRNWGIGKLLVVYNP
jgi:hypothetical protein